MHLIYNKKKFFLFVVPILIAFTMSVYLPVIWAFLLSTTNYRGIGEYHFIGLNNFVKLMRDMTFWRAMANTLKATVTTVALILPFSFLMALITDRPTRSSGILKTIYFAPYTIGGIIAGLIWGFILDPSSGLLNGLLGQIGLSGLQQQWIGGKVLTPYSVSMVNVWGGAGFCMLLWINGLKQIPVEVTEAAVIDGASKLQRVFHVTLPLLKETFKTLFVFEFTASLKVFESVQMLTGGGPNHYSETMVSYMYNMTFTSRLFAYGMSISVFEFLIALLVTVVFMRLTKSEVAE